MHKTVVINAVGLTQRLLSRMPATRRIAAAGRVATIGHVTPAVTCSVQTTYLTGVLPAEHGIVGNGWYFRDTSEIRFWQQSDKLVQSPRIWDMARRIDPGFTCANLFWWYAMYSSADVTATPRPMYPADGRKIPDIWTHGHPTLRERLQQKLGQFPLFKFWGPAASIESTRWIADAAIEVDREFSPTLSLIYLPHLDYSLQKHGPQDPRIEPELHQLDAVIARLKDHFPSSRMVILSEYGIEAVNRPIHLNRVLREHGLLTIRNEMGRELLDAGASAAFAVADHQVAHVYINDPAKVDHVAELVQAVPGVEAVLDRKAQEALGVNHPRAGELIAVAAPHAWFTYYYWLDDARAPDFARTVDIHRKPGYDPVELFIDPRLRWPAMKIGATLMKRNLGMRALLDVIPLDAALVRGSHGRKPASDDQAPLLISSQPDLLTGDAVAATDVCGLLLRHLTS